MSKNMLFYMSIQDPLYLPYKESDSKKYVKYEVIGENDVAVPTHFFKAIFAELADGSQEEFAYILLNRKIEPSASLDQFAATIAKVEKAAGIIFRP